MSTKCSQKNIATKKHCDDMSRLVNFAFCGTKSIFNEKIQKLAGLAEDEYWGNNYEHLSYFIYKTFERCYITKCMHENDNYCLFNTGLLTNNGEDIICFMSKNKKENAQKWYLIGFFPESSREILRCGLPIPKVVQYTSDPRDYYFDPDLEIYANLDHVLDENWARYPDAIKELGQNIVKGQVSNSLSKAKKKVLRNNRLVVPQYFENQIMFLLPIQLYTSDSTFTMALALEKIQNCYRANTVFTLKDAYKKARLIMKPESNWLLSVNEKGGNPALLSKKTLS